MGNKILLNGGLVWLKTWENEEEIPSIVGEFNRSFDPCEIAELGRKVGVGSSFKHNGMWFYKDSEGTLVMSEEQIMGYFDDIFWSYDYCKPVKVLEYFKLAPAERYEGTAIYYSMRG